MDMRPVDPPMDMGPVDPPVDMGPVAVLMALEQMEEGQD